MYCGKCGKQIADNSKFCTGCGAAQILDFTPAPATVEPTPAETAPEVVEPTPAETAPEVVEPTPAETAPEVAETASAVEVEAEDAPAIQATQEIPVAPAPVYTPTEIYKPTSYTSYTTNGQPVLSNILDNIKSIPAIKTVLYLIMLICMGIREFKITGYEVGGEAQELTKDMMEAFSIHDRMSKGGFYTFHILLLLICIALSLAYLAKIKHISGKMLPNIFCILVSIWILFILAIYATDETGIMLVKYTIIVKMRFMGYIHLLATLGSIVLSVMIIKKRKSWN